MSEPFIEYREEFNINDIARKYAERVARVIDEQTLANVENRLAEFGYVKVVRCRDCAYFDTRKCKSQWPFCLDAFCWWGKRKEGGE